MFTLSNKSKCNEINSSSSDVQKHRENKKSAPDYKYLLYPNYYKNTYACLNTL